MTSLKILFLETSQYIKLHPDWENQYVSIRMDQTQGEEKQQLMVQKRNVSSLKQYINLLHKAFHL